MTAEERYKITSNDYVDLIVTYNLNMRVFDKYPNATVHIFGNRYAIVYLPRAQLTGRFIGQYGYAALPACFGIDSEQSLEASGIQRLRRLPAFNLKGQDVLIGIVDTGIDYMNPIFLHEDGTSKIVALWDQTVDSEGYPEPFFYGTQYLSEDINQALASDNPLEIVPSVDEIGHGTMMAGIAVGNEAPESNFSGVAPAAELVVVKLKQVKPSLREFFVIPENEPCYQENDIMWGVKYVIDTARRLQKPVAICIGLGSSQGSHDGRGALSSLLSVSADLPGIVTSIAAGNEGNARRHFFGEIDPAIGYSTVELSVAENENGFSMELWGTAPNTYSIDILSPTGEYIPRITETLRGYRDISFVFERATISIDYQMVETLTGDQLILMRFHDPTPGIWRFQVYGRGDLKGSFHIWLPMNNFISRDTYFIQSDPYTTITEPGNSPAPITITAYNTDNNNLYQNSGRGFTRIGTIKPELAAPGVNILAPTLERGFAPVTGTSPATAHTAGVTALLLEWAIVRDNFPGIDTVEVKKFLIRGAVRSPNLVYPNRDWGYGILDIFSAFNVLRTDFLGGV